MTTGVEVIAVFDRSENYYRDAESAATALLDVAYHELHVRPKLSPYGLGHFPVEITRYTTDGTPGGDITAEVLDVFRGLPDFPRHPFEGTRFDEGTATDAEKSRVETWRRRHDDWRAEAVVCLIAKLALR